VRILGIDPGSQSTGWGLITVRGQDLACEAYGAITPDRKGGLPERLAEIHRGMVDLLDEHHPDEVAVEDLYVARNVRSALVLGHARGVILLSAAEREVPVYEYPANEVKKSVLGQGGAAATKERVAFMVRAILGLAETPEPADVSDALACAICHANKREAPG
jgi:crossover junction endodeoxyribonuclease RuvC